jgi:hypothetical protein
MSMMMRPWSKSEAVCRLFEGIPELVVKIFEYSNGKASAFVWLGMLRKGIYSAIWGNIELVRLMLQSNSQNSEVAFLGRYYELLDNRFHKLAKSKLPISPHVLGPFVAYAKRFLHLKTLQVCGLCGTPRNLKPHWHLGTSLCITCRQQNFISEHRLRREYGISLSTRFYGKMLANLIAYHVAVETIRGYEPARFLHYSDNTKDIEDFLLLPSHSTTVLLWRPHLAKMLDLNGLKDLQSNKLLAARNVLAGHMKTMLVFRTMWNLAHGNYGFKPTESRRPIFRKHMDQNFAVLLRMGMLKVEYLKDENERRKKRSKVEVLSQDMIGQLVDKMQIAPMTRKPYNP